MGITASYKCMGNPDMGHRSSIKQPGASRNCGVKARESLEMPSFFCRDW